MNRLFFYLAAALVACVGPFAGKKVPPWLAAPPVLNATFSSEEAATHLAWSPVSSAGFLYCEIQRATGDEFAAIARVESAADTTFTDADLWANTQYSYRVVSFFGKDETVHELVSTTAAGGFHRRVASWTLAEGMAPTRLAIGRNGTVFAVGAGEGRVERFDRAGRALGVWVYTTEPLACMETSALDGPALALDDDHHLSGSERRVACNRRHRVGNGRNNRHAVRFGRADEPRKELANMCARLEEIGDPETGRRLDAPERQAPGLDDPFRGRRHERAVEVVQLRRQ